MALHQIALIGVPGSGKSALAETLKRALERLDIEDGCECRTPVDILDGYTEDVEKGTDLAGGFLADYLFNLNLAFHRINCERTSPAKTLITCGTLIETATYVTMEGIAAVKLQDEDEQADTVKRLEATMRTLACLYMDTFRYDYAFYLPPLATPEGIDEGRVSLLDKHLQAAFKAFNLLPITPLMVEGTDALDVTTKRCEIVLKQMSGVPVEG